MFNLATDLRKVGQYDEPRELDQAILKTHLERLGQDHRYTLVAAANLAASLRELG
ncbi:tetratricopeptide repeat protein [Dactylosporangium sp. NPDC049525]|uniref:tetratricopeptide repeat protein n=1 Tax=Dactylosporangium sp. NPDC049525 TaxID=3154730 RepID=UPI00341E8448